MRSCDSKASHLSCSFVGGEQRKVVGLCFDVPFTELGTWLLRAFHFHGIGGSCSFRSAAFSYRFLNWTGGFSCQAAQMGPRVPMPPLLLGPGIGPLNLGRWEGYSSWSMGIQRWWSRPALLSSFSFSTPDARQQATMGCCCPPCKHSLHFVGLLRVKCLHSSLASAWLHWYLQICAPPYQSIGSRISWPFSYFIDCLCSYASYYTSSLGTCKGDTSQISCLF